MFSKWTGLSRTLAGAALLFLAGCSDPVSPGKDLQISNVTDSFQFQVTDMKRYTRALSYSWMNTGTIAAVNQACSITEGTAILTIRDANGTQTYSRNLSDNGTFDTAAGTSGSWTIELALSKTTGTLNFRVQKKP
jgi:hypothetical protein